MEFRDVIQKRRSIRGYRPDPVEQEKLDAILEAAIAAPTACNLQAFRILLIRTQGREEELRRIYSQDWFVEAPYILGICSIPERCWQRRDKKNYSDVDASIVMDHIILAATDQGLGTCWIGAFDPAAARQVLKLDDSLDLIAFTPVGYAKDEGIPRRRKALQELVIEK